MLASPVSMHTAGVGATAVRRPQLLVPTISRPALPYRHTIFSPVCSLPQNHPEGNQRNNTEQGTSQDQSVLPLQKPVTVPAQEKKPWEVIVNLFQAYPDCFLLGAVLLYAVAVVGVRLGPVLLKALRTHTDLDLWLWGHCALGAGVLLLLFRNQVTRIIGNIFRSPEQVTAAAQVRSSVAATTDDIKVIRSTLAKCTLDFERHRQQQEQNSIVQQAKSEARQRERAEWRDRVKSEIQAEVSKQQDLDNIYGVYQQRLQLPPPSGPAVNGGI